ncbi:MAG TPA: formimidoylglutamase [Chitinophagales bacterium]|nr:formimidoylglutamase [Chitinophagales bacterium]HNM07973.1 formimidoylglutamase [Chitinophagales bacterium]
MALQVYSADDIISRTKRRHGETKIGERIQTITNADKWQDDLATSTASFVVMGIPEDIGVRANHGRGGAYAAWKPSLDFLINMQSNHFLDGSEMLVLGHVIVDDLMQQADKLDYKREEDIQTARRLVEQVDNRVEHIIHSIVAAGKIPIVVGGGHNNAYPLIKGTSKACGNPIHVINCDPHSDMRPLQGRHSGNGFHYAWHEQLMSKYAVFGLHESYNIYSALELFAQNPEYLTFETYDDIFVRESVNFFDALKRCMDFVDGAPCGIEIDLDSIQNVPVSARTPSGMLPVDVRKFVFHCGENLPAKYLHIAEGAPVLAHKQVDNKTGKLVAYLITDFVKGKVN